jgi:hypothetical protein
VGHYFGPYSGRGFRVVIWRVVYPEEALLLGVVSVPYHEDVIGSISPGIPGDCKMTAEQMA